MIGAHWFRRVKPRWLSCLVAAAFGVTAVVASGSDADGASATVASPSVAADSEPSPYDPRPLPETVGLRVSIPGPIEAVSHVLLAEHLGEFERENLEVEILTVPSGDAIPALAAGDLDLTLASFQASLLNAIAQGFEIKLIAPLYHGNGASLDGLYLRNDLVSGAPANLHGATIATAAGLTGNNALPVGDYLSEGGVAIADVSGIRIPFDAQVAALESGEADAAWFNAPVPADVGEVATRVATFVDGEVLAGVVAGPSMLNGEPAVVEAFLRALARTVDTYMQGSFYSDEEVVAAMAASTGAPESAFVAGAEFVWSPTLELPSAEPVERLQRYLIQIPDMLVYDEPIPYEQLVDPSFRDNLGLD